jgi:Ran GTPase-activating protein (RanGAP) involved in mRNA processing and transport
MHIEIKGNNIDSEGL